MSNRCVDILPMSNLLVTSKLFNLDVFIKYIVELLFDDLCHGRLSDLHLHS